MKQEIKKFLEENSDIKPVKGNIVNSKGEILGKHKGLYYYTIGQRKGLGISNPVPLFVLGFNKEKNEVIVGEESELYKKFILIRFCGFFVVFLLHSWAILAFCLLLTTLVALRIC